MIKTAKIVTAHAKALYWQARMDKASKMLAMHKEVLATAGSGKHETEYGCFTVSENNTYDQEVMMEYLSASEVLQCLAEPKLSNQKVKVIAPLVYQQAKKNNGFKVSL